MSTEEIEQVEILLGFPLEQHQKDWLAEMTLTPRRAVALVLTR